MSGRLSLYLESYDRQGILALADIELGVGALSGVWNPSNREGLSELAELWD